MQLTKFDTLFPSGENQARQGRAGQGSRAQPSKVQPSRLTRSPTDSNFTKSTKSVSSPTHFFNTVCRFVYTFFFQGSAEMTKRKDGGRPDVVLQVMRAKPGLQKKVGSV